MSTSIIWQFFTVEDQADEVAKCKLCLKGLRRGKVGCLPKDFSTSPLHKHMKSMHATEYGQAQEKALREEQSRKEEGAGTGPSPKQRKLTAMNQMTLEESFSQKKYWDINDHRSVAIHQKVMNMIAIDNQPFSIAEDQGFIELLAHIQPKYMIPSRRYFSDVMLPNTYKEIKARLLAQLDETHAPHVSFTSDIWTSQHSIESFISLTAHWVDEEFRRCSGVLSAQHFPGSHTGENIDHMINKMMREWEISEERQHILVRDGASNMVLGLRLANVASVHCFLHILDLVVKDSIFSQRTIIDLCAKVRRIATHFNHSSLARNELKNLQAEQGIKLPLFPVQDVSTRWNSTYLMLERALTLKRPLQIYTANHDVPILSSNEWNLCEKILRILQPFFEITKQVSSEQSTLGDVIPHVVALDRYLSKPGHDSGVQTTKTEIRNALRQRLLSCLPNKLNVKEDKNYVLTTVVDPRYKFKFLNNKEIAKKWLLEEMQTAVMPVNSDADTQATDKDGPDGNTHKAAGKKTTEREKAAKQRTDTNTPKSLKEEIHSDFLKCYDEVSSTEELSDEESSDDEQSSERDQTEVSKTRRKRPKGPSLSELASEVDRYAVTPTVERCKDPLSFWKEEKSIYPTIAKVVRRYLSCPASSVYSERLFSEAGNVFEEHRARLLPRNGEHLLFLHHNLPRFPINPKL